MKQIKNTKLIYQILRLGRKYDSANEDSKSTIIDELEALVDEHNKKLINGPYCPYCGDKKQLMVSTDINSEKICKNKLCK